MIDLRFRLIERALSGHGAPGDRPHEDPEAVRAAVSLVVRAGPELEILLIKRAQRETDPWSGHMALPGGREEDADRSLVVTARRETLEETGLDLTSLGRELGRLSGVAPASSRLPRMAISPFVFGVPGHSVARIASPEVAQVHWVPIAELTDPRSRDNAVIPLPTGPSTFPCFRIAGEVVWGLTYRILVDFLRRYPTDELADLRTDPPTRR